MSITLKTHKLLWGKSGNRCAFEDCKNELIMDETETDDESVIGDEAHIVARKETGPRGISSLSKDDRDKYENLVLLCRIHHKVIDDQHKFYTVEKLNELKKTHEKWVKESLDQDKAKNKADLAYATYIDEIAKKLDFENWIAWTSWLMGNASISHASLESLESLPQYIISRFWPETYLDLENAIYNLKAVMNDLVSTMIKHADRESLKLEEGKDAKVKMVYTETFYKLIYHQDVEVYNRLLEQFVYHNELITDLTLELTRAGNLLIEKIRKYLYPIYREEEGKLLVSYGPLEDLSYKTYKVEYSKVEKEMKHQYLGLKDFMENRKNRDLQIGSGIEMQYFPLEKS